MEKGAMANQAVTTTTEDRLLSALKRNNPARVRAFAGDDDSRDIAVPTRRKRWTQVIAAVMARSWSRVELLDKAGAVLAYVDNVEPAHDVEDLEVGRGSRTRHDVEWMVNVIVRAQREALSYRDSEVANLLQAQGQVVREMSAAMRELSGLYREQADVAGDVAAARAAAEAAANGGDEWKQLVEALPVIVQALPMLKGLLAQPATQPASQPKPKNGA